MADQHEQDQVARDEPPIEGAEASESTGAGNVADGALAPSGDGPSSEANAADDAIERGTYEILRDRLLAQGKALGERAEALNAERLEVFGATEMTVIANERIRTENNCVPRDIAAIGDMMLFGYNVFIGLKTETSIDDVFSVHRFARSGTEGDQFTFEEMALDEAENPLADEQFGRDFHELFTYYKHAKLIQVRVLDGKVLAVFQTGGSVHDIKAFRWALDSGGRLSYIDNRGERDHRFPPSHDFEWTLATRADHVEGRHPHASIYDEVFIETVGGDLTVKVENNTEDGLGIYREPVDDADQSLDDAEIQYARVGSLILISVLPFREEKRRYLVFNTRTQEVVRIDAIGSSCLALPESQGIVFPGGYCLESGMIKTYDERVDDLEFRRRVDSPNGEDVVYVFYHQIEGRYLLLPYNVIRQRVSTPLACQGYSFFDDGTLVIFRAESEEPTRVHPMQIWRTPFTSDLFAANAPKSDSFLETLGNADLVRGVSDSLAIVRSLQEQSPNRRTYEDLVIAARRVADSYHWLGHEEVGDLAKPLATIRTTAELILDEFDKVQAIKRQAAKAVETAASDLRTMTLEIAAESKTSIDGFVRGLARLRSHRGHLITLREMRYADRDRLDRLEAETAERFDELAAQAVQFLLGPDALAPYRQQIDELTAGVESLATVVEVRPVTEEVERLSEGLDLLTEVVESLDVDDATARTQILESISEVLGSLNRARALLVARRQALGKQEGAAEFGAQFRLFSQGVAGAVALADTPDACDRQLSRLMLRLEELESRFADFDEYLGQLATKREEVYEALTSKKQQLLDQRLRRADHVMEAAERILTGVGRRSESFKDSDELNAYFAADPLVSKVRDLADQLRELGDSVRGDEIATRLKSSRESAARALRDRKDLFEEGTEVLRLGSHRFSVNNQALDLTLVPREDGVYLHATGTDFSEKVDDPGLTELKEIWTQDLVSESEQVYRAEFLAAQLLAEARAGEHGGVDQLRSLARMSGDGADDEGQRTQTPLLDLVRQAAAKRYDEGYERGVHDADATHILRALVDLESRVGLLRFHPTPRAAATLFWAFRPAAEKGSTDTADLEIVRARNLSRLRRSYGPSPALAAFADELAGKIEAFTQGIGIELQPDELQAAGRYLSEEIAREPLHFAVSPEARNLVSEFLDHLKSTGELPAFRKDSERFAGSLSQRYRHTRAWLAGFANRSNDQTVETDESPEPSTATEAMPVGTLDEATVAILVTGHVERDPAAVSVELTIDQMLGQHPRIEDRRLRLRLDTFLARLDEFQKHRVPAFRELQHRRHQLLEELRDQMRLDELKPKVLSTFVRNRLIDQVYLPLFGDNLAKQLGALGQAGGDGGGTDRSGLLLLVSPPGYGKTTLMEYVAARLGLVFVKANGPALGHSVHSLDPGEAPNATARREVERINLAFEMGNNVLLYLDDIQHTHPELLQKFISLTDAQRKVEGVWKGRTKTYDLRGKRFCVVMAGNPYTESGETFRIPDMLANRADVYNLGEVLEGKEDAFALSYLENALTANSTLAPLAGRDLDDVYLLVRMAKGEQIPADRLAYDYSAQELGEILGVLERLLKVQKVLLAVNRQYILSASQNDAYRTEPPFLLQGSYRNMAKLAARVSAVMNDDELEALIDDHYLGEAQTLTTGAEHNLLKLAELRGRMTPEQQERWKEIKKGFQRVQIMGATEDDPVAKVVGQLGLLGERLNEIGSVISTAAGGVDDPEPKADHAALLAPVLERLDSSLAALASARDNAPDRSTDPSAATMKALATSLEGLGTKIAQSLATTTAAPADTAEGPTNLTPYLDRLDQTLGTLAGALASQGGASGTRIVQTLPAGVHDMLEDMVSSIDDSLQPLLRGIARSLEGDKTKAAKVQRDRVDKTAKHLDQLKDLADALRRLDVRAVMGTSEASTSVEDASKDEPNSV